MPHKIFKSLRFQIAVVLLSLLAVSAFFPFVQIHLAPFTPQTICPAQLAETGFKLIQGTLSQNKSDLPDLRGGLWDLLKKIFIKKNSSVPSSIRGAAGLAAGILVPASVLFAYAFLLTTLAGLLLKKKTGRATMLALICVVYSWAGMAYLEHAAGQFIKEAMAKSARSAFGFVTQYFVPEIHVQAGPALYILPVLAISVWILSRMKR